MAKPVNFACEFNTIINMGKFRKLSHVFYKCEYHFIVFVPKYRYRILTGLVKTLVEHNIYAISEWKNVEVQLNVQQNHVHLVCSVPPKISISDYMGILKGEVGNKAFQKLC